MVLNAHWSVEDAQRTTGRSRPRSGTGSPDVSRSRRRSRTERMRLVSATLLSVNVGRPKVRDWAGIGRTSIDKHPVAGPVAARTLGLDGDQVSDTKHHGGVDQAVYAFAREDLDTWAERLGMPIPDGQFGENLTTTGIDVNEAEVGERWRIGSARVRGGLRPDPLQRLQELDGPRRLRQPRLGEAVHGRGPPGTVPAGRARGRGRGGRRDPRRAPARARRHRQHDVRGAHDRAASCCRSCCASTAWSTEARARAEKYVAHA